MLEIAVLLFFLGLLLVAIEIFVPSMGLLTLMAGASFIGAIVLAFQESTMWGLLFLGGTLVFVPALVILMFKLLPVTPMGKRLILAAPDRKDSGRGEDVSSEPLHDLVGRPGQTVSALRPAGIVEIDGRRIDVVTDGEWVDAGTAVVVTEVTGNRAVVAPRDEGDSEETQ